MKNYLLNLFILFFLSALSVTASASPSFDTANMVGHMKELVQRESRNELLKQGGEFVKSANALVAATNGVLKSIEMIAGKSMTPVIEWAPIVPKSVAELLKAEKPDEEKVQAEIEKLLLVDRSDSAAMKKTIEQQRAMFLKILTYAYASAERSLDLSGDAYQETEELKKKIEEHEDVVTLVRQMAVLQMLSTRKMAEILHLQSRMLEVDSMQGLIKKERIKDDEESTGNNQTGKASTDTAKSAQTAQ